MGGATYVNTFDDARHMMLTCHELNLSPSVSIFEPGFLRVALAYHSAGLMPPGALIKFYFGAANWGLPPTPASLDAYIAMLEGTGLSWSVAVLGGDGHDRLDVVDVRPPDQVLVHGHVWAPLLIRTRGDMARTLR